jgi:glycosyltransferase involved in cell wall biosynthesis
MGRPNPRADFERHETAAKSPVVSGESGDASLAGLRVALFSGNYNCVRDGANKALNRLADFLIARGAQVRVYSPTIPKPAFAPAGELVSVPSVPIPGRSEYRLGIPLSRAARADIRRFSPTLFHLSAPDFLGYSALDFAKKLGCPVVISHHTQFEAYLEYYRLNFLLGWITRRIDRFYGAADEILAPNAPIAAGFRDKGWGTKVSLWGRGVDNSMFSPARRDPEWRRSLGYADDEPVILFFGRVVMEKGLEMFAASIDALRARGLKVRPLVVGEGPALPWFRTRLPDAAFTGYLEGVPLARAIASADILINPSDTEAFGNVNLEAMASGLAIVSADASSASTLIENGVEGILVPPRDVESYVTAALSLMENPGERARLGRNAREASLAYSWDDIQKDVVEAYRKVASW